MRLDVTEKGSQRTTKRLLSAIFLFDFLLYPEKYAAKIQKYDASYALPQKNGIRNIIGSILKVFSH